MQEGIRSRYGPPENARGRGAQRSPLLGGQKVLELRSVPWLGFKQTETRDGIPGGRKGLSKCGEVGKHNIKEQVLSHSLLIHSWHCLVLKLLQEMAAITPGSTSKPDHDQKQKRSSLPVSGAASGSPRAPYPVLGKEASLKEETLAGGRTRAVTTVRIWSTAAMP